MSWDRIHRYGADLDRYVMVCDRVTWRKPAPLPGLEIVVVGTDSPVDLICEAMTVNEQGFDSAAADVDAAAADAFRPNLVGCLAVTARWAGRPVAGGMFNPVRDGLAEVAGVATLVAHRRRGFGAAVTSALTALAFRSGAETIFLTTDDDGARRVYLRVGNRDLGHT